MPRLCNPVLLTHDLTQSFRSHTFSLREDPWPNFSFRVAYAHIIATQCKSCFRIASASACLELSSATASATFRYAGFSLRKRNSRTSPLCNFIMEVFDAAQVTLISTKPSKQNNTSPNKIHPISTSPIPSLSCQTNLSDPWISFRNQKTKTKRVRLKMELKLPQKTHPKIGNQSTSEHKHTPNTNHHVFPKKKQHQKTHHVCVFSRTKPLLTAARALYTSRSHRTSAALHRCRCPTSSLRS